MEKYIIVKSVGLLDDLQKSVNEKIAEGYKPIGSISTRGSYILQSMFLNIKNEKTGLNYSFKKRRMKLNFSMQDVTDRTDISKATISRIEQGKDALYKTIIALDDFYNRNGV